MTVENDNRDDETTLVCLEGKDTDLPTEDREVGPALPDGKKIRLVLPVFTPDPEKHLLLDVGKTSSGRKIQLALPIVDVGSSNPVTDTVKGQILEVLDGG